MSKNNKDYKEYLEKLNLNETEKEELIEAVQLIVESLLDKKYALEVGNEKYV
jgi:hypothetical protein